MRAYIKVFRGDNGNNNSSDSKSSRQKIFDRRYKEDFEEIQCPGNDTYGKVMKCNHKLDLMEYAVKKIKIGYHDREVILREASTHANMHHKYIVQYHLAWKESLQPKSDHDDMRGSSFAGEDTTALFIQMECCPMTLHDLLSKETGLKGRFMMAKKNLVFYKKGEKVQVDAEGNKTYKALEAEKGPIDAKADVYSLRIILFMLLHPITSGIERKNSLDKLKRIEFPDAWENKSYKPLKSLLSNMLSENPDNRSSAEEVLPRVQDLSPLFKMDGRVNKEEIDEKVDKKERTEAVGEDGGEKEEEA
ncbi:hypothetical protein POTOM_001418 [Populus tomentosa]|uniref:Protein kinase domain-containing protein n=1 Tax=Populus tomentosa TaxID=118781 RepID=A0A8X8IYN1_POPTO|nr:hypothetical protein POTOM_001418 [Populus tomentosa]